MPTTPQSKRLYTLAHRLGLSHDAVLAEVWERYGVESTLDLTDAQYEQYTRDLELRAEGRTAGAAPPKPGSIHDKPGCETLLRDLWPELFQSRSQLALAIVDVMDWCRLNRRAGRISTGRLTHLVEATRKFDLTKVAEAVKAYLGGYTHTDERYFLGILRRLDHDAKLARTRAEKQKNPPAAPAVPAPRSTLHPPRPAPRPHCHPESVAKDLPTGTAPANRATPPTPDDATRAARLRQMASRLPEGSRFRQNIERQAADLEAGLAAHTATPPATPLADILPTIIPTEEDDA